MFLVDYVHKCVNPIEQAFEKGNLKPLQICVDCILKKEENCDFVRNPLAAARVKRLLNEEKSSSLGIERVSKAVKLLDSGPLNSGSEVFNAVLQQPEYVQDALARLLQYPNLELKGYTHDQLVDFLRFTLETKNRSLFEKISQHLFGWSMTRPDGNSVVIAPQLFPVYFEKSSRGAFLRDYCHGIKWGKREPEMELLLRYIPKSLLSHLNTFWISSDNTVAGVQEALSFAGPIRRLVIHGVSIAHSVQIIQKFLALFPDMKELVFDKVTWSEGYNICSYDHIPATFYEMLKKYAVSLRNVNIMGEEAVQNLGKIVELPEVQMDGTNWRDVTVEQEAMEIEEAEAEVVEPLDWMMDSTLLSYFCPAMIKEFEAGVTWPLDFILEHVSQEICYAAIKIPQLRPLLFKYAEKGFVEGRISHETISKLVDNARGLNSYNDYKDVNWFAHKQCETIVLAKDLELIALPTLPLMVQTALQKPFERFMKGGNCEIAVSSSVLQALSSWLRLTNTRLSITGQDLLDLDLLATQLGLKKIRESYTHEAFQGLDEGQIQQFLDRIPTEEQFHFVKTACPYHIEMHNNGMYLKPDDLLKHVNNRSPWGDRLQKMLRGVTINGYGNDELVSLVTSPEALACVREIHVSQSDAFFVLPTLTECINKLEMVVICAYGPLTPGHINELVRLSGNFTLLLDSVTLAIDQKEARWNHFRFEKTLRVVFRNVKLKIGNERKAFLLDGTSPFMQDALVQFNNLI